MKEKFLDGETDSYDCECYDKETLQSHELVESKATSKYGDLYLIGTVWVTVTKSALLGASSLIPMVEAASPPPPPPTKPPLMKYKELPMYKSPHNEYKEYLEEKDKCPERNVKVMRRFLLPYVSIIRKGVQANTCKLVLGIRDGVCSLQKSVAESKKQFTATMRDNENLTIRRAVVVAGTGIGFLLGGGRGIPRRVFMTGAGAATAGALCFPKETDEAFRTFTYYSGKTILGIANLICGRDFGWRERLPCKDDLPVSSGKIVGQCPPKKN
ncbi:hypothetical protein RR48_10180 [Papilio machaon]|uniref:MICOS complex subunit n=1 Tax=Papilio machaon TaxID=76193 RepID=A0A194R172_PAPMA|nr:hypothetical protein RR48_10180 [Papilio machaon]